MDGWEETYPKSTIRATTITSEKQSELKWTLRSTGSKKRSITWKTFSIVHDRLNNVQAHKLITLDFSLILKINSTTKRDWSPKLISSFKRKIVWLSSRKKKSTWNRQFQLLIFTLRTLRNATLKSKPSVRNSRIMRRSINWFINSRYSKRMNNPTFIARVLWKSWQKKSEPWSDTTPL